MSLGVSKKVLVIDDDPDFLIEIKKLLEEKGYLIETCEDPTTSVGMIMSFKPDCIILDLLMRRFDGHDLAPWLRKQLPHLPIIVLTGIEEHEIRKRSLGKFHIRYILRKPFNAEKLFETLGQAMNVTYPDRLAA